LEISDQRLAETLLGLHIGLLICCQLHLVETIVLACT